MPQPFETATQEEKTIVVGLIKNKYDEDRIHEYLEELSFLIDTAGGIVVKRFIQRLDVPDTRTFIGSGKLMEIKLFVAENKIDAVIFDDELSPSQVKNIEQALECKVLDRNNLILYIFAKRARTAHAKTQVELAQYQYLLPRLTRMWTHLSKQKGGIGMRGPGEKEIETDRRIIRDKIALLKEKLKHIDKQKTTQRQHRQEMVRVALVGYTNVGKSTIMNLLSKSDVFAENKLFATLDTTVRKVVINQLPFLLSDTVGFIRKLPHSLIESFKSTLDEVREADILLHVVDISHPYFEEQIHVVRQTLMELGVAEKKLLMIFNKTDAFQYIQKDEDDLTPVMKENISLSDLQKTWMAKENAPCLFISALKKDNIEAFRKKIYEMVKEIHVQRYPHSIPGYDYYDTDFYKADLV